MIGRSSTTLVLLLLSLATGGLAQQPTQKPWKRLGERASPWPILPG